MEKAIIRTRSIKFSPIIGLGYWKDVYKKEKIGVEGVTHNFIIPFVRMQWGFLIAEDGK